MSESLKDRLRAAADTLSLQHPTLVTDAVVLESFAQTVARETVGFLTARWHRQHGAGANLNLSDFEREVAEPILRPLTMLAAFQAAARRAA